MTKPFLAYVRPDDDFSDRSPPLKSGDGGGTSGGMETRVAALEADMKEVKTDLKGLVREVAAMRAEMAKEFAALRTEIAKDFGLAKSDVAELKGRVSQIPTAIQLGLFVIAIFGASGIVRHFFP